MWKKSDSNEVEREAFENPASPPTERPMARAGNARATIGPSISIHGDVTGEEDLLIQGRIEGKIDLKQHNVTVGPNGKVKADIYGRTVTIEGEVEGSLFGGEQIVLRHSARVRGNVTSPRVTLEDGAVFKGSIDMEAKKQGGQTGATAASSSASAPPASTARPSEAASRPNSAEPKSTAKGG